MGAAGAARKYHVLEPLPGCHPEIGRWLGAMEDARARTLRALEGLPPGALDAQPFVGANTIGMLLYHIAGAEASWLYEDVLEGTFPADVAALFLHDMRDEQGLLSATRGFELESYLHRLQIVRGQLLATYGSMGPDEFRRIRSFPPYYDVTPEWVLHHLMQHEAEHRGHIQQIVEGLKSGSVTTGDGG